MPTSRCRPPEPSSPTPASSPWPRSSHSPPVAGRRLQHGTGGLPPARSERSRCSGPARRDPPCYKPGHQSRLIYRPRRDDGRRDGRKSFSWRDYRDLLTAAHQQLNGPIVLIWDNLNVHKAPSLRRFAQPRDWLTVYYAPPYAPDLNPVEGI